jgi:glycosyltransferase involved in cell wall biosynthesis
MLIHLIAGSVSPYFGFGVHVLSLQQQLERLQGSAPLQVLVTNYLDPASRQRSVERLQAWATHAPIVNVYVGTGLQSVGDFRDFPGHKVIYTVFETDVLPDGWAERLRAWDLVITASSWGAGVLRRVLPTTPVVVVPEGVEPALYHQWGRPNDEAVLAGEQPFCFLAVGKYETRKSYDELLQAFQEAFGADPSVRLLLKPHNMFDPAYEQRLQEVLQRYGSEQVMVVRGPNGEAQVSEAAMANIYRSSQCFVFPSKGEGWGLPLIEAISCGCAYLATHYSGHTEFLEHCPQLLSDLPYSLVPVEAPDFLRYHRFSGANQPRWAQPLQGDLVQRLRQMRASWPVIRHQAQSNARVVHQRFNWAASAEVLVDCLMAYVAERGVGG